MKYIAFFLMLLAYVFGFALQPAVAEVQFNTGVIYADHAEGEGDDHGAMNCDEEGADPENCVEEEYEDGYEGHEE